MNAAPFIHAHAICESTSVGDGTRIWAFAHILPGARIGADCNICDHVFIEGDVVIGDRVTIKSGVQLWDGVRLANDVFVGPNATFTNDRFPRSKSYPKKYLQTNVARGASIGANATILPGLDIGPGAMIGAGAVVTRSVPANAIVVGNPARIAGYVNARLADATVELAPLDLKHEPLALDVGDAQLFQLRQVRDLRGSLAVAELNENFPFKVKRFFVVFDVPTREVRGEHAHYRCHQFLICLRGSVSVLLDDGSKRRELTLDRPDVGVYVPALIWGTQYKYSADATLLVFASEEYDPKDYIRSYDDYVRIKNPS